MSKHKINGSKDSDAKRVKVDVEVPRPTFAPAKITTPTPTPTSSDFRDLNTFPFTPRSPKGERIGEEALRREAITKRIVETKAPVKKRLFSDLAAPAPNEVLYPRLISGRGIL